MEFERFLGQRARKVSLLYAFRIGQLGFAEAEDPLVVKPQGYYADEQQGA